MLPRPLPRASAVWVAIIGGAVLVDWWADRGEADGDSVSEQIRRAFHTDTTAGKAVFTLTLVAGACWLHLHILKEITT